MKAGQYITTIKRLSEDLGFSPQQIRTALKKLESTRELTSKSTNKFTVITVINWGNYQDYDKDSNKQNNKRITNEQQHIKNSKNVKNVKKSIKGANAPLLSQIVSFVESNGLNVDCEKFFRHYEKADWKTADGNPITDWKRLLRVWSKKEKKTDGPYKGGYDGVRKLGED